MGNAAPTLAYVESLLAGPAVCRSDVESYKKWVAASHRPKWVEMINGTLPSFVGLNVCSGTLLRENIREFRKWVGDCLASAGGPKNRYTAERLQAGSVADTFHTGFHQEERPIGESAAYGMHTSGASVGQTNPIVERADRNTLYNFIRLALPRLEKITINKYLTPALGQVCIVRPAVTSYTPVSGRVTWVSGRGRAATVEVLALGPFSFLLDPGGTWKGVEMPYTLVVEETQ